MTGVAAFQKFFKQQYRPSNKLHGDFSNAGKDGAVGARLTDRVMAKRTGNHGLPRL